MTFLIIYGLTYLINTWGNYDLIKGLIRSWTEFDKIITLSNALIIKYSATICASDSVAALTMIKPSKYPKLFSVVFGEGMINDAVAIILFTVVGGIFSEQNVQISFGTILKILGQFVLTIVSSLAIGGGAGTYC